MYFKEIALGGLLHDIGKFYQKAKNTPINNKGKHPQLSKEFVKTYFDFFNQYVDANVLMEFVARHHSDNRSFPIELLSGYGDEKIKNYTHIVDIADNLSSSERDEQVKGNDFRVKPLDCIFNRVNINKSEGNDKILSYKSNTYNINSIFPQEISKNENYSNEVLVQNFTEEINLLTQNPPKDFYHLMIILDKIFKKYLWCIPASSLDKISDVSLYDHLKTTSAIASTLYLYQTSINKVNRHNIDNDDFKHLLVAFNFSGVQNYIMDVADSNNKGVSRQLRTRSFLVDMIIESIANEILQKFNLPIQNKLIVVGGKCFILLPNVKDALNELYILMKSINDELLSQFKGEISINYSFVKVNKLSFKNYGETITNLNKSLERKKYRPFETVLTTNGVWNYEKFTLYNDLENKTLCSNCKKRIIDKNNNICNECNQQIEIGALLPTSNYVVFNKISGFKLFLDNYINLVSDIKNTNFDYVMQIYYSNYKNLLPTELKHMANYIPIDKDNNALSFEDIAEKSKGSKKLALIKIDIDNLGYILKEGLKKDDTNFDSISRIATLSRMIDMFFTEYIKHIIETEYKNTYVIYSGGDDLLLITPFSDAVSLVRKIYIKFNEYVGNNDNFTLSTSVVLFSPKTHIALALEECNKQMEDIKSKGGNKVYFMKEQFSYSLFANLFLDRAKLILENIDKIDINILRRVSKYSNMYRNFLMKKDINELMFMPLFDRDIRRNYDALEDTRFYKYITRLTKNMADYRKENAELYYMQSIIKYILILTKEDRNNGNI